tara:strand:- start:4946 stop:6046 length:1101 start_codon:yes stop_codon:yes gene_type:complete
MINAFNNKSVKDTLSELNQTVLKVSIPIIVGSQARGTIHADEKIEIFKEKEEEKKNEDLNGSLVKVTDEKTVKEKRVDMEFDLDINSCDRKEWSLSGSDNAYSLDVNLGAGSTFAGISTQISLKNVKSVDIAHVLLPDIDGNLDKYPFLYLRIDEIPGMGHSTSEEGRKSLVKLMRDKKWSESSTSNVSYILFGNRGGHRSSADGWWYTHDSLININKLSIRILTPNGFQIQGFNDVFSISHIKEMSNDIEITFNDSFGSNNFHVGNRIGFKDLSDEPNIASDLATYLENNEFEVSAVSTSTKKITIKKTISGYSSDGSPEYDDYGDIDDIKQVASGKTMNLSIQSTFGFNIKSTKFAFPEKQQIT